eukprot:IDg14586t1
MSIRRIADLVKRSKKQYTLYSEKKASRITASACELRDMHQAPVPVRKIQQ